MWLSKLNNITRLSHVLIKLRFLSMQVSWEKEEAMWYEINDTRFQLNN